MPGFAPTSSLALALFGFWLILSGKFDALHLGMGALSSIWIAVASRRLLGLSPPIAEGGLSLVQGLRLAGYLPWLAWQIVIASLDVMRIVLDPRLPISPRLLQLRAPLPHNFARLVLANSITLTPGTVTLDVDGDDYVIHALTPASAASLGTSDSPGPMVRRIAAIFGGPGRGEA